MNQESEIHPSSLIRARPPGAEHAARSETPLFQSVEDGVHQFIRDDILEARLAPGTRLGLEGLAQTYGVSLTPVRHALRRLHGDGLVVLSGRRGASVSPLSVEEVEEIQAIRLGVETRLAQLGASQCTDEALSSMEYWQLKMGRAYQAMDIRAYIGTFRPFKDPCYRCADRPRLWAVTDLQRRRIERYVLYLCRDPKALSSLQSHQDAFLDACRMRDPSLAEAVTHDGLVWVRDRLQDALAELDRDTTSSGGEPKRT